MRDIEPRLREIFNHRWQDCFPGEGLTWGKRIDGQGFVRTMMAFCGLKGKNILEVGPGYGRILQSMIDLKVKFNSYTGVDMSQKNVDFLKEKFPEQLFICVDAEDMVLTSAYDVIFSSLTFKHIYPSYENMLVNIVNHLIDGGYIFYDLIEGNQVNIEPAGLTFVRRYMREEIELLHAEHYITCDFAIVKHDTSKRLFVCGRKK